MKLICPHCKSELEIAINTSFNFQMICNNYIKNNSKHYYSFNIYKYFNIDHYLVWEKYENYTLKITITHKVNSNNKLITNISIDGFVLKLDGYYIDLFSKNLKMQLKKLMLLL